MSLSLALAEIGSDSSVSITIAIIALVVNTAISSIALARGARARAAAGDAKSPDLTQRVTKLETEMHQLRNRELQRIEVFMDRIERRQRRNELIMELVAARLRIQTPEPVFDFEKGEYDDQRPGSAGRKGQG